jgi:hypothetical protein
LAGIYRPSILVAEVIRFACPIMSFSNSARRLSSMIALDHCLWMPDAPQRGQLYAFLNIMNFLHRQMFEPTHIELSSNLLSIQGLNTVPVLSSHTDQHDMHIFKTNAIMIPEYIL